ncbi:MAG: hypothetical protein ACUVQK_06280 [Thermogutta sp.]
MGIRMLGCVGVRIRRDFRSLLGKKASNPRASCGDDGDHSVLASSGRFTALN